MKRKRMQMRPGRVNRPPGRDPGFGKVPPGVASRLQGSRRPSLDPGFSASPKQLQGFGRGQMGGRQQPVHVPGSGPGLIEGVLSALKAPQLEQGAGAAATALGQAGSLTPPQQAQQQPAMPWTSDWEQTRTNPYTGQALGANEYVGWAGSEAQHPDMVRIPPPGWWDESNPNYERRNYYVDDEGRTIVREPGYYNPDAPMDTGREEGRARNLRYSPGSDTWKGSNERRASEPGITPWGPGGKPTKPGAYAGPPAGAQHPSPNPLLDSLLGPQGSPIDISGIGSESPSNVSEPFRGTDPTQALLLALSQMLAKLPSRRGDRNAA